MKFSVTTLIYSYLCLSTALAATWYVPAGSNLAQTVEAADAGDTVIVGPGTFMLPSEIVVSNGITVAGEYGPEWSIIDADGLSRCMYIEDTVTVLSGLTFRNGYTTNSGGAVYCAGEQVVMTNCVFHDNQSMLDGGAVFGGTVWNSIFRNNVAYGDGGGANNARVVNSLFHGNRSYSDGGALYQSDAVNCTLSGNIALLTGGGMYGGYALNSIIYDNLAGVVSNELFMVSATNSCAPSLAQGVNGNVNEDPGFADPAGWDYRLTTNSPCIDTGTNMLLLGEVDLDALKRTVNGSVDMGAYEFGSWVPDADGDGLPDAWELQNSGSRTGVVGGVDLDGDLYSNHDEYIAGTSPTDVLSKPDLAITASESGSVVVWKCVPGRVYSIEWKGSLTNGFASLQTNLVFPTGVLTDQVHAAKSSGFYRLEVMLDQ